MNANLHYILLAAITLSACGGAKQENAEVTPDIDSDAIVVAVDTLITAQDEEPEATATSKTKTSFQDIFSAEIQPNGSVFLSFNDEAAEKACDNIGLPFRTGASPYLVEDLAGKCVEVLAANPGNGDNWMLYMRTEDGHIAMLSVIEAITSGKFACSGNLDGFENVTGFKVLTDQSATGVYAVFSDGSDKLIKDCPIYGYYFLDDFEIHLTRDWNISFYAPAVEVNSYGKFHFDEQMGEMDPNSGGFNAEEIKGKPLSDDRVIFKMTDKRHAEEFQITIYSQDKCVIALYTDDYALEPSKDLTFNRSDVSQFAD